LVSHALTIHTVVPNGLTCPEGHCRLEYVDNGCTGLYMEVRAANPGQGMYYLHYKDACGKTCHQKIGCTADMDPDEARRRAKRLNQITRREIQSFHARFREDGLSPAYSDHFAKLMRRYLNLAVEWGLLGDCVEKLLVDRDTWDNLK